MAHTTSRLSAKLSTEAQNNDGIPWSAREAQTELLIAALGFAAGVIPTGQFNSVVFSTSSPASQIPVGVLSWSFTCLTGTAVVGSAGLNPGQTVGGGGYGGNTMKNVVTWSQTGTCLITWDVIA